MSKNSKEKVGLSWRTERRRVNDLLPHPKNPRVLDDAQREALTKSLKIYGLAEIPAINSDNQILAGHQRIKVLQLLGRGEEIIDVRIPSRLLTQKEADRYLLTSNAVHGSFDNDILRLFPVDLVLDIGFNQEDLARLWDDALEVEPDYFDAEAEVKKIKKTDIKPGDLFALGRHKLLCGNALNLPSVMKLVGNDRASMINIDTPYNINLSYDRGVGGKANYGGTTNDRKTDDEFRIFVKTIIQNALMAAKPDCHAFFWCDERYVWLFQMLYKELGLDAKRLCIWVKDNASPVPTVAFNKVTEFCVYGTRGSPYLSDRVKNLNEFLNKELTTGNRLPEEILDMLSLWLVKRLPSSEYQHPTSKNPTLHEKALRRCTRPGDIVLDLTAGSGSIMSACEQLKRTAYLAEIEPIFCQLIINRFKQISHDKITKLN